MTDVFLVKAHSWDYDFHDDVIATYSTKEAAIAHVDSCPGKYNERREEGLVVERWIIDFGKDDEPEVVYYQGGVIPGQQ